MKRIFVASALSFGLASGSALAADMAVKAPPPSLAPAASVPNWTGCYVNGGGGYGMWNQDHTSTGLGLLPGEVAPSITSGGRGWFGTAGAGCDYQFSALKSNFVAGVLADFDLMDFKGVYQDPSFGYGSTEHERWAWAVGGRIGYLVTPSLLTYVNGGYTETRFDPVDYTFLFGGGPGLGAPTGASLPGHTYVGGFLGGGTEYALSSLPGLFWRSEYRYASYRADNLPIDTAFGVQAHVGKDVQTISTELVYKFGWAGQQASAPALDLPLKARPAQPVAAANWTGCYVDGGGGYGMWNEDTSETFDGVPESLTTTNGGRGWFGRGGAGCDYQFSAFNSWKLVAGPFGDFDLADIHGTFENPAFGATGDEKERSAWAVGGRLGYIAAPSLLTYVNGGYSQARFDSVVFSATPGTVPSHSYDGWFVGGGTEYAVAWLPGLFWRNEYRYAGYRSSDLQVSSLETGPGLVLHSTPDVQTIDTALVYKFNWNGGPVTR